MKLKLLFVLAACLSCVVVPAAGASLLATAAGAKGAIIEAGLGADLSSSSGSGTVFLQVKPETVAVEAVPSHQLVVQKPAVNYQPVQSVSLIPVATFSSPYSFTDRLSNLFGGLSNAIATKTRAVGDFLQSFRSPPRIVLIKVDKTTTTTTTTEKPKHKPKLVEIVGLPGRSIFPYEMPVLVDVYDKKK